jgi:hypothetical protein
VPIAEGRGFTFVEYDHGANAPLSEVQPTVVSRALGADRAAIVRHFLLASSSARVSPTP